MSGRDPFPMQSEEARRLEASVQQPIDSQTSTGIGSSTNETTTTNTNASNTGWNKMGTTVTISNARVNDDDGAAEAEASLMMQKQQHTSGNGNDPDASIYDHMDTQTKAERYLETEDEYLDNEIRIGMGGGGRGRGRGFLSSPTFYKIKKMLLTLHVYLYGNKLPPSETIRTLCLSSTLFFMIGGYWLLRSLKDPVLTALCGVEAIPKAKMLSVGVVLGVVSVYNRLLDSNLPKHTLFYIFGMFYFGLFTLISVLLTHPTIGLPNQNADMGRLLGWISYCSIESFGSVMVSLFWSFANSNFKLENAKASYGLLVATAQIGSILGPTIVQQYAEVLGVAKIYFIGAIAMLFLQGTMYVYIAVYGTDETRALDSASASASNSASAAPKPKKNKAGVLEGLHLFVQHNYVKGIFAISCLFMVEVTIVDFTMKVLARNHFASLHPCISGNSCWDNELNVAKGMSTEATAAFTTFMGLFGQATNILSFLLSFFGTSAIIRKLGLRLALLLFPTLCLIVIVVVRLNPTLYVVFAAMMILKANSYALNNPTKEMLYQPTSSAVRYKAKSWIDIFGARGSKAMGSVVTNAFSDSAANLVQNGSMVGMAVASFLIWNARYMGRTFEKYVETGYIVGEENDGFDGDHVELADDQNEGHDTSCAIEDDIEIKENISDHDENDVVPVEENTETDENESEIEGAPAARVEMV